MLILQCILSIFAYILYMIGSSIFMILEIILTPIIPFFADKDGEIKNPFFRLFQPFNSTLDNRGYINTLVPDVVRYDYDKYYLSRVVCWRVPLIKDEVTCSYYQRRISSMATVIMTDIGPQLKRYFCRMLYLLATIENSRCLINYFSVACINSDIRQYNFCGNHGFLRISSRKIYHIFHPFYLKLDFLLDPYLNLTLYLGWKLPAYANSNIAYHKAPISCCLNALFKL